MLALACQASLRRPPNLLAVERSSQSPLMRLREVSEFDLGDEFSRAGAHAGSRFGISSSTDIELAASPAWMQARCGGVWRRVVGASDWIGSLAAGRLRCCPRAGRRGSGRGRTLVTRRRGRRRLKTSTSGSRVSCPTWLERASAGDVLVVRPLVDDVTRPGERHAFSTGVRLDRPDPVDSTASTCAGMERLRPSGSATSRPERPVNVDRGAHRTAPVTFGSADFRRERTRSARHCPRCSRTR